MPETDLESLVAYLRQKGEKLDPEAWREHLLAQGYDPGLVDQALEVHRKEGLQNAQERVSGVRVFLGCLGGLVAGSVSFASLAFGACIGVFGEKNAGNGLFFFIIIAVVFAFLAYTAVRPVFSRKRDQ